MNYGHIIWKKTKNKKKPDNFESHNSLKLSFTNIQGQFYWMWIFFESNSQEIWSLSDCNWTRTYNHLVHKRTFNHLAKLVSLAKWFSVRLWTTWLWVQVQLHPHISQYKYQVKPHSSQWFLAACTAAIVHRNHFFCLH